MSTLTAWAIAVAGGGAAARGGEGAMGASEPVRLIFDTDIGNDVDDVLALGLIHALESRGHCELLAVTVTKDHPLAAKFVDAVNTFYGRGDVPIGAVRGGATPEEGKFLGMARTEDGGEPRYPQGAASSGEVPEATKVLRRALAGQPDGSVVLVQVGFSTNLARLLDSGPDEFSELPGRELVARKARELSIMAGHFQTGPGQRFGEYNVKEDLGSFRKLIADWPTPIMFSGFEIGIAVPYPAESVERDYGYAAHHPLEEAYRLYEPPPHNRPTWDLTSVIWAVFPDRGYFGTSAPGRVTVEDDSHTTHRAEEGGPHRYLTVDAIQAARLREAMVQLCSQPPAPRVRKAEGGDR